jgi:hypothetical protein
LEQESGKNFIHKLHSSIRVELNVVLLEEINHFFWLFRHTINLEVMEDILDFEDGEVTVHKENIVLVKLNKFQVLSLINVLIELSKLKLLLFQCFNKVLILEMLKYVFQNWTHELF